jgi:hypothetical protein
MPEQVQPIHGLHPYCTTSHPSDLTPEMGFRKKRRQTQKQTKNHDNFQIVVKLGTLYFFFHGWTSCCKKVLGNSSDWSKPKGSYSFSLGI